MNIVVDAQIRKLSFQIEKLVGIDYLFSVWDFRRIVHVLKRGELFNKMSR